MTSLCFLLLGRCLWRLFHAGLITAHGKKDEKASKNNMNIVPRTRLLEILRGAWLVPSRANRFNARS
jgi:hypothetical protein